MNMGPSPNSWLFSDNSRYSTQARLLFMGLSFAIGILTFLLYLCIWYVCTRHCHRLRLLPRRATTTTSPDDTPAPALAENNGGMSPAAIAALPTTFFACGADDDDPECAVCLGQVEAGEKVRRLPACAHSFHADCVDAWLRARTTCPMCRAPVVAPPAAAAAATKTDDTVVVTTPIVVLAAAAAEEPLPPV